MTENSAIYGTETGPIPLAIEKALRRNDDGVGFFNDYGFVVRAKAETGEDLHFWSFIYEQKGPEVIVDCDVVQTLLVVGKYNDEEKQFMHPNALTVNKGQNLEDYYKRGTIKIEEGAEHVKWMLGGITHHGAPPNWRVTGEQEGTGLKVDLSFEQKNPAFYHCGLFEDLEAKKRKNAGYIVHTTVTGTFEVDGKVLKIAKGYGVHERIQQAGVVPDRTGYMAGRGLTWQHGFSDNLSFWLMRGDIGKGMSSGMINIGDKQIILHDPTSSGCEEAATWIDPVSRLVVPYQWRTWIRAKEGTLEAKIYAYGRSYYTWIRRGGTLVVNQFLADADVTFTYPDGTVLEEKCMVSIEHMRTLYRQLNSLE
ncbi:hypothetical protein BU16DRAFT_567925 [Lophium mytilinum]|uniref:AttH domain-containing protein n=1 Tax=Lophium mytilinum TaxID=390894 RepID=A0A6A6Q9Q5_9PEZI|nr:hypothetical protein BU16DRAFT_567925 [Lophium mytilinum]